MNVLEYKYENQIIEFDISGNYVMVNATEMSKPFGKRPIDFLRQSSTKAFISILETSIAAFRSDAPSLLNPTEADLHMPKPFRTVGESELNAANANCYAKNVLRTDRGKGVDGGQTWMHRQLALKFAAWLSPEFEVWIYQTIEGLIFGNLHQANDTLKRKAVLQERKHDIMLRLQENDDYQDLLRVNAAIKVEDRNLRESNNSKLDLFKRL